MKEWLRKFGNNWKEYALAGCVCILFFFLVLNLGKVLGALGKVLSVLRPVIFGFIIAYIINPLAVLFDRRVFRKIKKKKLRWSLSVIVTIIIVLLILVLIALSLIPQMIDNVVSLADNYEYYVDGLIEFIENQMGPLTKMEFVQNLTDSLSSEDGFVNQVGKILTQNSDSILKKTTDIGNVLLNWLLGGIFAVYFLLAKHSIAKAFDKAISLILSPLRYQKTRIVLEKFNSIFSKYIVFELIDALIVGVANYLFMIVMGMPDAVFISFIIGITNLVPTFGPFIGLGIGGFILLLVQPGALLPLAIFTLVIQLLDANVIKPKLFGDALNVPGSIILIGIVVFGKSMGIVGMLLAIPIVAILTYFYADVFIPWLELRRDLEVFRKENGN